MEGQILQKPFTLVYLTFWMKVLPVSPTGDPLSRSDEERVCKSQVGKSKKVNFSEPLSFRLTLALYSYVT